MRSKGLKNKVLTIAALTALTIGLGSAHDAVAKPKKALPKTTKVKQLVTIGEIDGESDEAMYIFGRRQRRCREIKYQRTKPRFVVCEKSAVALRCEFL